MKKILAIFFVLSVLTTGISFWPHYKTAHEKLEEVGVLMQDFHTGKFLYVYMGMKNRYIRFVYQKSTATYFSKTGFKDEDDALLHIFKFEDELTKSLK